MSTGRRMTIGRVDVMSGDGARVVVGTPTQVEPPTAVQPPVKPAPEAGPIFPPAIGGFQEILDQFFRQQSLAEQEVRFRVRRGVAISYRYFRRRWGAKRRQVKAWAQDERNVMRHEWQQDPNIARWAR